MRGIVQAVNVGMAPIKINAVIMRGVNDDEILALARMALDKPYHVRFIELMPTSGWEPESHKARFMPVAEIKEKVRELGPLEPAVAHKGNGPAQTFQIPGATGTVGFIAALSNHFCRNCNRLRLTSDGKLRNCLFSDAEIDIKGPLRRGAPQDELERLLGQSITTKPMGHQCGSHEETSGNGRPMQAIGG
jgi:cyclic pyranopterin phosphate synthase